MQTREAQSESVWPLICQREKAFRSEFLAQIEASQQLPSVTEAQSEGDQQSPGLEERCCETELELAKYREALRMYPMRNLCLK